MTVSANILHRIQNVHIKLKSKVCIYKLYTVNNKISALCNGVENTMRPQRRNRGDNFC